MSEEMTSTEARQRLGELVNRISYRDEEVVIVRRGKPMAALISYTKYELFQRVVEHYEDLLDRERTSERAGEESQTLEPEDVSGGPTTQEPETTSSTENAEGAGS